MKRAKAYLVSSILFAMAAVIWSIVTYMLYQNRENPDALPVLQGCCVLAFGAGAVLYFIRYRRSNRNQDEE